MVDETKPSFGNEPALTVAGQMRHPRLRFLPAIVAIGLVLSFPPAAGAVDPYEIQVYDGTANSPGVPGAELHVNTVSSGRRTAEAPELPPDRQTHFTLEPSFGVTPSWELGAYLQTTLRPDGAFTYAGAKLRSKFVTDPEWHAHWRFGVNLEVSLLPQAYDRDRWGTEVRPIAAWEDDLWLLAINPILNTALAGSGAEKGPSLEPALMAKVKIVGKVALGFEYYAAFGPVAHPAMLRDQEHYLYEAIDLLAVDRLELNLGIGEGLTASSNGLVVKMVAGYTWDRGERAPGPASGVLALPSKTGDLPRRL